MPRWGLASAVAAPVLMIGGWTLAAAIQGAGFDSVSRTISDLAAVNATSSWIMTIAILTTGASVVATAVALRPAAMPGRIILGIGGAAAVAVAFLPLPAEGHSSSSHSWAAGVLFVALSVWPFASWRVDARVPWGLRPAVAVVAGLALVASTAWFFYDVEAGSATVGVSERVNAAAIIIWPLAVAISARRPSPH